MLRGVGVRARISLAAHAPPRMANRWQPFDCSIAGKAVSIGLRHGGGCQEPATVYVRCDQRDCQYVDVNAAPCPLRVEMFADGTDHRLAEYLTAHAGERHCYGCLSEQLDIIHDQVRRASWRLKDAGSRFVRCAAPHVTVAASRSDRNQVARRTRSSQRSR